MLPQGGCPLPAARRASVPPAAGAPGPGRPGRCSGERLRWEALTSCGGERARTAPPGAGGEEKGEGASTPVQSWLSSGRLPNPLPPSQGSIVLGAETAAWGFHGQPAAPLVALPWIHYFGCVTWRDSFCKRQSLFCRRELCQTLSVGLQFSTPRTLPRPGPFLLLEVSLWGKLFWVNSQIIVTWPKRSPERFKLWKLWKGRKSITCIFADVRQQCFAWSLWLFGKDAGLSNLQFSHAW